MMEVIARSTAGMQEQDEDWYYVAPFYSGQGYGGSQKFNLLEDALYTSCRQRWDLKKSMFGEKKGCWKSSKEENMTEDRMMKWFAFEHLPQELRLTLKPFFDMAAWIEATIEPGPERTVALRKLLEAKDAAIRAKLFPGG